MLRTMAADDFCSMNSLIRRLIVQEAKRRMMLVPGDPGHSIISKEVEYGAGI